MVHWDCIVNNLYIQHYIYVCTSQVIEIFDLYDSNNIYHSNVFDALVLYADVSITDKGLII